MSSSRAFSGFFVAEGSSDLPLSDLIEVMFLDQGLTVDISNPDFAMLGRVPRDVKSRISAGHTLMGGEVDLVIVHRDADGAGTAARRSEIQSAVDELGLKCCLVPVIPVRMMEAWLLLDEAAIRRVAGNPRGRIGLGLPKVHQVESVADPKKLLSDTILLASQATGRRREQLSSRFNQHRRQLLVNLDSAGPVTRLAAWKRLVEDISGAADLLRESVQAPTAD